MQKMQVQSLGWENPLEKGMATHCSILAWRIPWTEEPGWLQSTGLQTVRQDCHWKTVWWVTHCGTNIWVLYLPLSFCVVIIVFSSWCFPCSSAGKESAGNAGDLGSIPGLGRSVGEKNSYPLKYSGLENSYGLCINGVAKSQTWLSGFEKQ